MKRCLIVFAKEPERGKVKTRLRKELSETDCVRLYKAMLLDSITSAAGAKAAGKILAYKAGKRGPAFLKKIGAGFKMIRQRGSNLGGKMHNAFKDAKADNFSKIVIVGSDAPELSPNIIEKAYRLLGKKDIVFGPSVDGGYYLVGLKNPCNNLFRGIEWSASSVLKESLKKAKNAGKSVGLLAKLRDVDEPDDLIALKKELKRKKYKRTAKWTRKFLGM